MKQRHRRHLLPRIGPVGVRKHKVWVSVVERPRPELDAITLRSTYAWSLMHFRAALRSGNTFTFV